MVQSFFTPAVASQTPAIRPSKIISDNLPWSLRCDCPRKLGGHGSQVVKVSDHGWRVMSSSPVPLKTHRVGERCTLNLSRAQTSSHWCGVVVRRGSASSGVVLIT
ncbi:uncharacterized protein TNCV_1168311 [Trichonephila clavipes]|uniref:Uncharacterized protein n=1 Tax=Trichonephila clavipes TaxID=2585209 RepID=A0A8X6T550_TRICX|nr:uncharacterized protein TNCV_1168311 [Trichonephila clavipes]